MDVALQAAIIGALFTFFGALLTILMNFYRERSEREKWRRTLELEERKIKHEENKWTLELNNQRELELMKSRLSSYPEVFASLGKLSHHNIKSLSRENILELSDKFNSYGYGLSGLCMLPDTRDAAFVLRDYLKLFADKRVNDYDVMGGPRTDLIELMRRDLSHDRSVWRDYKPLIQINREKIQKMFSGDTR